MSLRIASNFYIRHFSAKIKTCFVTVVLISSASSSLEKNIERALTYKSVYAFWKYFFEKITRRTLLQGWCTSQREFLVLLALLRFNLCRSRDKKTLVVLRSSPELSQPLTHTSHQF